MASLYFFKSQLSSIQADILREFIRIHRAAVFNVAGANETQITRFLASIETITDPAWDDHLPDIAIIYGGKEMDQVARAIYDVGKYFCVEIEPSGRQTVLTFHFEG